MSAKADSKNEANAAAENAEEGTQQAQPQDQQTNGNRQKNHAGTMPSGKPLSAYPKGSSYCGDFVCDSSGKHIGIAPGEIHGRRSDQDLGDAVNIATAVGVGSAIKALAEDVGKVEAGRLFGTRMGGTLGT